MTADLLVLALTLAALAVAVHTLWAWWREPPDAGDDAAWPLPAWDTRGHDVEAGSGHRL